MSAMAAVLLAAGCRSAPVEAGPGGTADASAPAHAPRVVVESPSGRSSVVAVEVARTPQEQERGLMFRERLGPDDGMLFVFPETSERVFWMKNTLIPLDLIFADASGVVVGVVERAEPLTTTTRGVGAPSRFVLEVNGGWSAGHGVRPGDRLRFEDVPGVR